MNKTLCRGWHHVGTDTMSGLYLGGGGRGAGYIPQEDFHPPPPPKIYIYPPHPIKPCCVADGLVISYHIKMFKIGCNTQTIIQTCRFAWTHACNEHSYDLEIPLVIYNHQITGFLRPKSGKQEQPLKSHALGSLYGRPCLCSLYWYLTNSHQPI